MGLGARIRAHLPRDLRAIKWFWFEVGGMGQFRAVWGVGLREEGLPTTNSRASRAVKGEGLNDMGLNDMDSWGVPYHGSRGR